MRAAFPARERGLIRPDRGDKAGILLRTESVLVFLAGAAAAHLVDSGVVSEADEKSALITGSAEDFGLASKPDKYLLKDVAGILRVLGEV